MKATRKTEGFGVHHKMTEEGIHITQNQKLSSIQKKFTKMFPYLKLVFFKDSPKKLVNTELVLGHIHKETHKGEITITPFTLVKDLERAFYDLFKIVVKVLRRLGKSWLETRFTEDWSLFQQNAEGKEISIFLQN